MAFFHSGDLSGCTNNFIPETSKLLAYSMLKRYGEEINFPEFIRVADLAFSRYRIAKSNEYLRNARKNPHIPIDPEQLDWFHKLLDNTCPTRYHSQ